MNHALTEFDRSTLLGKSVEVIMDSDHSRTDFRRKGKIVRVFSDSPAKEAIGVELEPIPQRFFSRDKHRYLILEYPTARRSSLEETFVSGGSFAVVLRPKGKGVLEQSSYRRSETKWVGFAEVRPWPNLS